ncbi:MAG TPA: hypothetical protein VIF10_05920 [Methylobacter sp.]|jgi:NAD(P)-dependent dehydrogenase (short-subunit alcohol dehydrogenase family)
MFRRFQKPPKHIAELWPDIDVPVSNAGAALFSPFEKVMLDELDALIALDVKAPYLFIRARAFQIRAAAYRIIYAASTNLSGCSAQPSCSKNPVVAESADMNGT